MLETILIRQAVLGCFRPNNFTVFGELTKALLGKNRVPVCNSRCINREFWTGTQFFFGTKMAVFVWI